MGRKRYAEQCLDARVFFNLQPKEYDELVAVASRNRVSLSMYLRAIVIDVLEEERDLQRSRTERCSEGRKERSHRGAPAERDHYRDHVRAAWSGVDAG